MRAIWCCIQNGIFIIMIIIIRYWITKKQHKKPVSIWGAHKALRVQRGVSKIRAKPEFRETKGDCKRGHCVRCRHERKEPQWKTTVTIKSGSFSRAVHYVYSSLLFSTLPLEHESGELALTVSKFLAFLLLKKVFTKA